MILLVAVLGGLIPTVVYVLFVWWMDRYEKEPVRLLAAAFLWGAIPAAVASLLMEVALEVPTRALGGESLAANLISSSLTAPLVEESCKGLALVGLVLLVRREVDDVLDGIVYGAMIGFGFALTENVFAYYAPIASQQGLAAGSANLFWRSIVFGANHAFWSATLGMAVGYALLARERALRALAPLGGWLLAVSFHAVHNTGAALSEQTACLSLGVSLLADWGGIALLLLVAARALRRERQWIEQGLVEEVQVGLLGQADLNLLRSAGRRFSQRLAAWRRGGRPAHRLVGRYFQCATELAFAKVHPASPGDEGQTLARVERLRHELGDLRMQATPWLGS
jgi:RsiW-degrading membrane proteinase PrsW (M82 family)